VCTGLCFYSFILLPPVLFIQLSLLHNRLRCAVNLVLLLL
jgi:hypothetical protein